ncbi:hypothetical protein BSK59_15690 [Paenibacillus odorifer]|uniref:hypothetical protein n=1 Tax=Paenibacillus odorifer TaxID=189426 RepID=UPI00096BF2EA|nr:hypothetical protein [Paenibacillus odorifer]OME54022.1 hypothetical protein BSK59_15690 [Paenibacillus odorifer]
MVYKLNGYDMKIKMDYDMIIRRFEGNHNRKKYFADDDQGYWELINKAIVIGCRMAVNYNSNEKASNPYDDVLVSGGGGGGDTYTIFTMRNDEWWQKTIGDVEINFKEKTLKVWLYEWEKDGVNYFNGKREYNKTIDLSELDGYKVDFYEVQRE